MADYVVHHFTHTDLDGVGCAILSKYMYDENPEIDLDIKYCNYDTINEEVTQLLDEIGENNKKHRLILITDISVNEEVAQRLDKLRLCDKLCIVMMFDHHQLSREIRSYEWATVDSSGANCGISLMYNYFFKDAPEGGGAAIFDFVRNVKLYDLWLFDPETHCIPLEYNMLLYTFGKTYFEELILHELFLYKDRPISFSTGWVRSFLDEQYALIEEYLEKKSKEAQDVTFKDYKGKYVFAEKDQSRLGNRILKDYPEADFAAIIAAPNYVSLRSRKDGVNVGEDIAKYFGGGGHPAAAGYTMPTPIVFTME